MEVIRALSARILAEAAYGVLTASDGVEAMEALERSSPVDLVLTDLKMPRMDGHQLALQVASRWPGLRVLFMTGYPEVRLADDLPGPLLLKPFTPEQLDRGGAGVAGRPARGRPAGLTPGTGALTRSVRWRTARGDALAPHPTCAVCSTSSRSAFAIQTRRPRESTAPRVSARERAHPSGQRSAKLVAPTAHPRELTRSLTSTQPNGSWGGTASSR